MYLKSIEVQDQIPIKGFTIEDKIHCTFPIGIMEVCIGEVTNKFNALVDTGAELSIIPEEGSMKEGLLMRDFHMRLKVIGGHRTAIVGLSENTSLLLPSGYKRRINCVIAQGDLHTVIGIPFLSEKGIRTEHPQKQGEIISYKESDGRRLCIQICTPESSL
ncbi:hypothetical protein O181_043926 [Austropuccinia psidii MF-1]|uniref:Peptidase A2 domain-containing protein n=1 Tax=Austropuccinia psidii MF-1 TaxID=1389203 RepID=A0A9Q3DHK5_9BASI|nr:hypothetical protein [Austropuccinia psidii MF-1]